MVRRTRHLRPWSEAFPRAPPHAAHDSAELLHLCTVADIVRILRATVAHRSSLGFPQTVCQVAETDITGNNFPVVHDLPNHALTRLRVCSK